MIENKKTTTCATTQYFGSISANSIMVGYGCAIGWLSMALPLLNSDDSPLDTGKLTISEVSWIGAVVCIGALIGNLVSGYIVTIIGSRHTIFMIGFPQLVSDLLDDNSFCYNFVF